MFTDFPIHCDSKNFRNTMHRLYLKETGNGKNFTYFKPVPFGDLYFAGHSLEKTDLKVLHSIQHARSNAVVLNLQPNLDEIIMSILLEGTKDDKDFPTGRNWENLRHSPIVGASPYLAYNYGILQMSSRSFRFLTCDGNPSVNFLVYFQSFDLQVWLLLIATVIVLMVTVIILTVKLHLEVVNAFPLLLSIIALLLNTVVYTKEQFNNLKLRGFYAIWLLTSIIISNAYKGINFSKTAAPNRIPQLQNFNQLSGFQLFSKHLEKVCPNQVFWTIYSSWLVQRLWFQALSHAG